MCSVNDSEVTHMEPKRHTRQNVCMKCGEAAILVIRMNDPFCRSCFVAYVVHKFRATIGKSKLIRDGEKVLVAVSGGPASSCLVQLIQDGLGENVYKKLRFKPSLVYIDEGAALGQSKEERLSLVSEIQDRMVQSGFPAYVTTLQMDKNSPESTSNTSTNQKLAFYAVSNEKPSNRLLLDDCDDNKIKNLIGSIKSLTEKENFVKILRYNMLVDLARQTGHTKVMCADTASRLAVKLLSGIAQGRGGHIPFDTGFADSRHPDVLFVRPLKDFAVKEVAMFNLYHNITPIIIPSLTSKTVAGSSIEHLTEDFVYGLQSGYLATVSNITRTGEKLEHVEKVGESSRKNCAFCQAPLDTTTALSSAPDALSFSRSLTKGHEGQSSISATMDRSSDSEELLNGLCYGCRITVLDIDDWEKLPQHIQLTGKNNRSSLRARISDCLLEDDMNSPDT